LLGKEKCCYNAKNKIRKWHTSEKHNNKRRKTKITKTPPGAKERPKRHIENGHGQHQHTSSSQPNRHGRDNPVKQRRLL